MPVSISETENVAQNDGAASSRSSHSHGMSFMRICCQSESGRCSAHEANRKLVTSRGSSREIIKSDSSRGSLLNGSWATEVSVRTSSNAASRLALCLFSRKKA